MTHHLGSHKLVWKKESVIQQGTHRTLTVFNSLDPAAPDVSPFFKLLIGALHHSLLFKLL